MLAAAAPLPAFDVIAAGDDVPAKKPAADIYCLALQKLGLPATRCLAFEDTANGLNSAAGAGLRCVLTLSAYGGAGPFPGAVSVLPHLGDPDMPAHAVAGPKLPNGIADLAWLASLAAD